VWNDFDTCGQVFLWGNFFFQFIYSIVGDVWDIPNHHWKGQVIYYQGVNKGKQREIIGDYEND